MVTALVRIFRVTRYSETPFWYALCKQCGWHAEHPTWATALNESHQHVRHWAGREDEHAVEVPF